jgi:glycosyltransferase involved in cell wall biosynthesis
MKKKLIIFMPSIEGYGVEKNLFIICNYLAKRIADISLITVNHNYQKFFNKKINFITPKNKFWIDFKRKIKYLICIFLLIKKITQDKNVVVFSFQANIYCILICKFFSVKVICRANSSPSGWALSYIKNYIYKNIFKLSDKIIVNSIEFKNEIKKKFSLNSVCIYNPLNYKEIISQSKNVNKFNFFKKKNNEILILNIGRLVDQKDHETLLKAINIIDKKINYKLLIIGEGDKKIILQEFIKENNLHKKVKIINFQKNPYKFIKLCDLFILSSIYEGLPNVLLEAASLKKFIISSNCPTGPSEILSNGKGGILFEPKNFLDLAKKIESFFYNKRDHKTKINYTFKRLSRFDYKTNLNKYLNLVLKELN